MRFDRRWGFVVFVSFVWLWIGFNIYKHTFTPRIKAIIIQSKNPIRTIDDPIVPIKKEILYFETIDFPKSKRLWNSIYGDLGYTHDFIINFFSKIYLAKDQYVKFIVYSDDGFRLKIDGKDILEFRKDRPFSKSETVVYLSKGAHRLKLKYFQGYGQLGLKVYYTTSDTPEGLSKHRNYLIGKSNGVMLFDR